MSLRKISIAAALGVLLSTSLSAEEPKAPSGLTSTPKKVWCITDKAKFLGGVNEKLDLIDAGKNGIVNVMVFRSKANPAERYIYDVFQHEDIFFACEVSRYSSAMITSAPPAEAPEPETDQHE